MFYKVTQLRSTIALPAKIKDTLIRLGLRKRGQTVYQKVTRQQAGMLANVKELVQVELTETKVSKKAMHRERKTNPGFIIN